MFWGFFSWLEKSTFGKLFFSVNLFEQNSEAFQTLCFCFTELIYQNLQSTKERQYGNIYLYSQHMALVITDMCLYCISKIERSPFHQSRPRQTGAVRFFYSSCYRASNGMYTYILIFLPLTISVTASLGLALLATVENGRGPYFGILFLIQQISCLPPQ